MHLVSQAKAVGHAPTAGGGAGPASAAGLGHNAEADDEEELTLERLREAFGAEQAARIMAEADQDR